MSREKLIEKYKVKLQILQEDEKKLRQHYREIAEIIDLEESKNIESSLSKSMIKQKLITQFVNELERLNE